MLFRLLESRKLKNIPNATYPNPKINLSWYNIPGIPYGARKFLYISGTWYVTTYRPPQNHGELHARQATGSLAQIVEERYSSCPMTTDCIVATLHVPDASVPSRS